MSNRTTLRVLLVLSMIGSGFSFLGYAVMAAAMPAVQAAFGQMQQQVPAELAVAYERLFAMPRLFFAVSAVLCALSLLGVTLMWRLRRAGFHCYALAQLLLLIVPVLFLGKEFLGLGDIMFTALFVAAYYFLFKSLGKEEAEG